MPNISPRGWSVPTRLALALIIFILVKMFGAKISDIELLSIGLAGAGISLFSSRNDTRPLIKKVIVTALSICAWLILATSKLRREIVLKNHWIEILIFALLFTHILLGLFSLRRRQSELSQSDWQGRIQIVLKEFFPEPVAKLAAAELIVLAFAFDWRPMPSGSGDSISISYHKGAQPLFWTIAVVSCIELIATHFIVEKFSNTADFVLCLLGEFGILYIVGMSNSLRRLPLIVSNDGILIRAGLLVRENIAFSDISEICSDSSQFSLAGKETFKANIVSSANTLIRFTRPITMRHAVRGAKEVRGVALYTDRAGALLEAFNQIAVPARS